MTKKEAGSINTIREERFIETNPNAFVVLSKEESDRIVEQARIAKEARKTKRQAAK